MEHMIMILINRVNMVIIPTVKKIHMQAMIPITIKITAMTKPMMIIQAILIGATRVMKKTKASMVNPWPLLGQMKN